MFRFAAIEALRDDGEAFAGDVSPNGRARRAHTLRVPVGLVAAITPFNHPLNQVAHKLAPAIAAGAQIVCGEPAAILDEFLAHEAVEVVSFTDGVAVGKSIAERLGYRRAVLELGGNDPMLVLADADLDEDTDVGTVIDESAARVIEARIAAAVDAGASLLCGGERAGALLAPRCSTMCRRRSNWSRLRRSDRSLRSSACATSTRRSAR